jgi:hypothetical protein
MIYNPLRSVPRTVGKNNDMSLVEYTNPPERGNIHPEKFQPTKGKLLIIHNR